MDLKQDGADGNHQDREVDQKLHGSVRSFELTHGAKRGDHHACSGRRDYGIGNRSTITRLACAYFEQSLRGPSLG